MTFRKKINSILFVLSFICISFAEAYANEKNVSPYEEIQSQNHGHVGIHQRREAFRERIMDKNADSFAPVTAIEPAAGDTEKASKKSRAENPHQQREYNP